MLLRKFVAATCGKAVRKTGKKFPHTKRSVVEIVYLVNWLIGYGTIA
jgi:hypothetical protein